MSRRGQVDAALILLTLCAAVAAAVPISGIRPVLVIGAALVVPGAAVRTLLDISEALVAAAVAVAISIAIDIVGSLVLVWTEFWHPNALAAVLGLTSIGLLLTDLRRSASPRGATSSAV